MQNLELGLSSAPHEEHPFSLDGAAVGLGIKRGSGDGKVPGSPNVSCADTIPGGPPPTGFSAVPALGGIPPGIIPEVPIPGIKPGDCELPEVEKGGSDYQQAKKSKGTMQDQQGEIIHGNLFREVRVL